MAIARTDNAVQRPVQTETARRELSEWKLLRRRLCERTVWNRRLPNGQCGVGYGARSGSACPNGNCGINGTAGRTPRYPTAGLSSDWAPRTGRNLADPYRRSGSLNDEAGWTQRSLRPVLDPVNDTFRSRYNREELDLNSEYFRGNNGFDRDNDRYRPSSRDWNGSSDRSMEAPAPSTRSSRI